MTISPLSATNSPQAGQTGAEDMSRFDSYPLSRHTRGPLGFGPGPAGEGAEAPDSTAQTKQ